MKPLIVIGDIHNKTGKAEEICNQFPNHIKLFIGDYFDDFGDSPAEAEYTANWLKYSLQQEDRIHLMGNHDYSYKVHSKWFPLNHKSYCSGYTFAKQQLIDNVLSIEDWKRIQFHYYHYGWHFSHAGLTPHWFATPISGGMDLEYILQKIKHNEILLEQGEEPLAFCASDRIRGGRHSYGGLLWGDWSKLPEISNFKQVVGHTPCEEIQVKFNAQKDSFRVNVDCHLQEVLEIKNDGILDIFEIS